MCMMHSLCMCIKCCQVAAHLWPPPIRGFYGEGEVESAIAFQDHSYGCTIGTFYPLPERTRGRGKFYSEEPHSNRSPAGASRPPQSLPYLFPFGSKFARRKPPTPPRPSPPPGFPNGSGSAMKSRSLLGPAGNTRWGVMVRRGLVAAGCCCLGSRRCHGDSGAGLCLPAAGAAAGGAGG